MTSHHQIGQHLTELGQNPSGHPGWWYLPEGKVPNYVNHATLPNKTITQIVSPSELSY